MYALTLINISGLHLLFKFYMWSIIFGKGKVFFFIGVKNPNKLYTMCFLPEVDNEIKQGNSETNLL